MFSGTLRNFVFTIKQLNPIRKFPTEGLEGNDTLTKTPCMCRWDVRPFGNMAFGWCTWKLPRHGCSKMHQTHGFISVWLWEHDIKWNEIKFRPEKLFFLLACLFWFITTGSHESEHASIFAQTKRTWRELKKQTLWFSHTSLWLAQTSINVHFLTEHSSCVFKQMFLL